MIQEIIPIIKPKCALFIVSTPKLYYCTSSLELPAKTALILSFAILTVL